MVISPVVLILSISIRRELSFQSLCLLGLLPLWRWELEQNVLVSCIYSRFSHSWRIHFLWSLFHKVTPQSQHSEEYLVLLCFAIYRFVLNRLEKLFKCVILSLCQWCVKTLTSLLCSMVLSLISDLLNIRDASISALCHWWRASLFTVSQ